MAPEDTDGHRRTTLRRGSEGDDLFDAGDPVAEDALDPGGQCHRRHRAAAAGADELERDPAAVGAEQDQVAAVRLQGRPDVLQGLLQDAEVDVGDPADGVAGSAGGPTSITEVDGAPLI